MQTADESGVSITRRELLVGGGLLLASVSGLGAIAGCGGTNGQTSASAAGGAQLPWPYVTLGAADVKKVQETAHDNWFTGFCAFATLSGIVTLMREKVGEPYLSFPTEVITYAHGGTAGWGGTCGTLTGAGMAASLAAGPKTGEEILNEVMKWYSETALPIYKPDNPKADIKTVSTSNSPLCHVSVGKWMKNEGVGFLSAHQMERCARLSSDVSAKTVEFLNQKTANGFAAVTKSPVAANGMPSQNNCTDCHGSNVPPVPAPGGGESLIQSH